MASLMIHLATAGGTPASSASLTRCSTTFGAISGMSCVFSLAIITSYGCEPGPGRGGSLSSDEPAAEGDGVHHGPLGGRVGGKAKSPEGAISLVWVDTPGRGTADARKWPTTRRVARGRLC